VPILLTGVFFAGDLLLWHLAIMRTTIANATFFATMAPIWVVIFGWLVLRQRVGATTLGGLGLCVLGGAALVYQSLGLNPPTRSAMRSASAPACSSASISSPSARRARKRVLPASPSR
jgi:drug/metabolite transporter (DMT)-like permease